MASFMHFQTICPRIKLISICLVIFCVLKLSHQMLLRLSGFVLFLLVFFICLWRSYSRDSDERHCFRKNI